MSELPLPENGEKHVTAVEWVEAMKNHSCENKNLVSEDVPKKLILGARCKGCGQRFCITLVCLQLTPSKYKWRNRLRTPEGREKFIAKLNNKAKGKE